jgi:hypothetical protein
MVSAFITYYCKNLLMLCSWKQFSNCVNVKRKAVAINLLDNAFNVRLYSEWFYYSNCWIDMAVLTFPAGKVVEPFRDWPLHYYKCTVIHLVPFLSNHSNNVCECPVFEYLIEFCILLHSETKESSNGSSGSYQGDGTKANSNESMPVCQRPSSSLSLQSISSEFSFRKIQLITYSKLSF